MCVGGALIYCLDFSCLLVVCMVFTCWLFEFGLIFVFGRFAFGLLFDETLLGLLDLDYGGCWLKDAIWVFA